MLSLALAPTATITAASTGEIVVINEDFSKFTEGTEETPDAVNIAGDTGVIPDKFLNDSHLSGLPVYQAGGCAYMGEYYSSTGLVGSKLITQDLNASSDLSISFRAKTKKELTADKIKVSYLNYDTDAEETSEITSKTFDITNNWQTFTLTFNAFSDGDPYIQWQALSGSYYIDDIKVTTGTDRIEKPVAAPYSDYKATSFRANWNAVDGASSYLLSVYILRGSQKEFIFKQKEVTGTSYEVTGLDGLDVYYYYVQAKSKAGRISSPSKAITVNALVSPTMNAPEKADDNFTVSWNAVPRATDYDFWAYRQLTPKKGEKVILAETQFNEIKTSATVDYPDESEMTADRLNFMPGWMLYSPVYANGVVGFNDYYQVADDLTCLESPEFDLSMSDGKVDVKVDIYTQDAAGVILFNNVDGQWEEADRHSIEQPAADTEAKWTTYNISLEGGSKHSAIRIYGDGMNYTFIDNLTVSATAIKDSKLLIPSNNTITKELSVKVPANWENGATYAYRVRAVYDSQIKNQEDVMSPFTQLMYINKNGVSSVNNISANGVNAFFSNGQLKIVNPQNLPVAIYNANGSLMPASTDLPKGFYIVRIGNWSFKVLK